jgi:cytidylate kinase
MKIAIDGPAGAGKSTVAKALAQKLGFVYIDTGAMYRALTWKIINKGIDPKDAFSLYKLASSTDIHFETKAGIQRIICDGEDLTEVIRSPEVSTEVSSIAAHPLVREIMVKKQRLMSETCNVIMDGRDIGEQVLPDAEYKFFLTAGLQERAKRRALEMQSQGYHIDENEIEKDIANRDKMDSEREVGALKILEDSIVIDTSNWSSDEVMQRILSIIGKNGCSIPSSKD